jgi:pyruvate,water dikinase
MVLLAKFTSPKLFNQIKYSKAVITDEGGSLSHAAVLCREFKIPCIVGTKIATQVLKKGNLVEVDASKGLIKIINQ